MKQVSATLFSVVIVMVMISILPWTSNLTAQHKSSLESGGHKGKVIETMNSGGYSYILFQENDKKLWVASRQFKVAVGDTIEFSQAAPMKDFYSKTLDKKFDLILFVNKILVNGQDPWSMEGVKLPKGHLDIGQKQKKKTVTTVDPGNIKKAENGYTIAECYEGKETLANKVVKVRGKAVKFTARIMGKNWLHIQDGSGKQGSNDLTVTTRQMIDVGDVVVVSGKIAYDKDFGAGYVYKVIIEDATVTVE